MFNINSDHRDVSISASFYKHLPTGLSTPLNKMSFDNKQFIKMKDIIQEELSSLGNNLQLKNKGRADINFIFEEIKALYRKHCLIKE